MDGRADPFPTVGGSWNTSPFSAVGQQNSGGGWQQKGWPQSCGDGFQPPSGHQRCMGASPQEALVRLPVGPSFAEEDDKHDVLLLAGEIDGKPTELLVDTGAEYSIISVPMLKRLGLQRSIDPRGGGVAAGVGFARILGTLRDCRVRIGRQDFNMNFRVLGIDHEELVILGMDFLQRFKCSLDLGRRMLRLGGPGAGEEVPFLPPKPSRRKPRSIAVGCPTM